MEGGARDKRRGDRRNGKEIKEKIETDFVNRKGKRYWKDGRVRGQKLKTFNVHACTLLRM